MGKKRKLDESGDVEATCASKKAKKMFNTENEYRVEKVKNEETELSLQDRIHFIKSLKDDPRSKGVLFETEEHHHHVFGYQNIGHLESVLSKMHSRRLLKHSTQSGGVIVAFGKITLSKSQPIYNIHPYLHVDYRVQCLILKANKNTTFETKIEGINGSNAFSTFLQVPVIIEGVQDEDEVVKGYNVNVTFKKFSYDERSSVIKAKLTH
ncbi:unnamed protein product [Bursaphelenchus xylophilus]|uniref:(pine wood nematode) hypothetical protein n=1 Tax=Bursaphelenchus xylophilus TaxID=6326 RepID=A0A1I7STN3_BURXY|nr:unnamed protein product [Bursaphelenchus xylophilus]CAG9108184.1 unnamed protein product [Bursaphelenchus xylophilus]